MAITTTDQSLLRLLQLSSVSLPVGAYAFSQGLEYAIEETWLNDSEDIFSWLDTVMRESLGGVDLPLIIRLDKALNEGDYEQFNYWNAYSFACRETKELYLSEASQGLALRRLLKQLEVPIAEGLQTRLGFVAGFTLAAHHWQIPVRDTCLGFVWSWLENQVAAATKLVPLGQSDSQKLLLRLQPAMVKVLDYSEGLADEDIGSSLPALAMASAWHETQYTRIFRS